MKTREHREKRPRGDLTEEIRHEAYLLWQQDGCPDGHELDHWLAAQEKVRHRHHARHAPDDAREDQIRPTEQLVTPN
ncbi:MAG: DUF2934 domain-containing protein [Candidatus Didemnitutus sp.]|nr:DUF2934 domain-containing protein [Candidatus Didemnitutus sp.]